jgi:hypothetical protein
VRLDFPGRTEHAHGLENSSTRTEDAAMNEITEAITSEYKDIFYTYLYTQMYGV